MTREKISSTKRDSGVQSLSNLRFSLISWDPYHLKRRSSRVKREGGWAYPWDLPCRSIRFCPAISGEAPYP
ncbi:unnamed protein product [Microthlaspi erraticum]|uniref:Uncharacterized protein n=1 Tax=Microthlaspi erraticum TaxID=1685480 RepID=A0A6D2JI99_9BRAS|nr:unnamed protein product [Microthlaspi erraticum]